MNNFLLPISRNLLERKAAELELAAIKAKQEGMSEADGDNFHDEVFKSAENSFHVNKSKKNDVLTLIGTGELMSPPEQMETATLGHMVIVQFKDDPYIKSKRTIIHLVTTADKQILDDYIKKKPQLVSRFNEEREQIISITSPLGSALMGLKRGMIGKYLGRDEIGEPVQFSLKVLDTEDAISVSSLFNIEF